MKSEEFFKCVKKELDEALIGCGETFSERAEVSKQVLDRALDLAVAAGTLVIYPFRVSEMRGIGLDIDPAISGELFCKHDIATETSVSDDEFRFSFFVTLSPNGKQFYFPGDEEARAGK